MSKKTGVIDEPVNYLKEENDKLGINDYAKALTNFIENTETPMTIGIQESGVVAKPH